MRITKHARALPGEARCAVRSTFAVVALCLWGLTAPAFGATGTWNSAASTDFNDTNNWTWMGGSPNLAGPGLADTLVFPNKTGALVNAVLTADAYTRKLDSSASALWQLGVLPSAQVLHLGAGGLAAKEGGWNCFKIALDADQTWNISTPNSSATIVSNALSGIGRMTKSGTGALSLAGDNSGFSGGITLTEGTLGFGHSGALGTGTFKFSGAASLTNGATTPTVTTPFEVTAPAPIAFLGRTGVTFTGPWTLSKALNFAGPPGGAGWTHSGIMSGPGGLWNNAGNANNTVNSPNGGTLTLSGTGKTFTGPMLAGADPADIGNWTVDMGATGWTQGKVFLDTAGILCCVRERRGGDGDSNRKESDA